MPDASSDLKPPVPPSSGRREILESLESRFARHFQVHAVNANERPQLEQFIQACFARNHGAQIRTFMPRLLSLRNRDGGLVAAFGLRDAAREPLFLERYLEAPIEQLIRGRFGQAVPREAIVEVGNLSALHPGATRWLVVAATLLLHREGYRWVTFTATSLVRNGLHRLGLRPLELESADPERLPQHEREQWGNYYQHSPTVMTGELARGCDALCAHAGLLDLLRADRAGALVRDLA